MRRLAALAALGVLGVAAPADAAKPNLKATKVSAPPKTVAEYGKFKVFDTVVNAGRARAGASTVRYYLTTDAARSFRERKSSRTNPRTAILDILLEGTRSVPALDRGERSSTKPRKPVAVRVPLGTRAGEYVLLACADDHGEVTESKEADNCVASKKVVVSALPIGPITTFNDWLVDESDAEEAEDLAIFKPLACQPVKAGPSLGLKRALANIDGFLKSKAPEGVRQFAASPDYRNANRAETAAAHAILAQSPGAALAATVRAHRLEPKEASHLVNAAGVATSVGLPREALALLDASLRLDDRTPSSWGLGRQALQLTNRAHALAALGQFAAAERLTEAVELLEPTLTEATATGATAAMCLDNIAKAVTKRKRARRRTFPPTVPFDENRGKEHPLRKVELPGFPGQAPRLRDFYKAEQQQGLAETQARVDKQSELEAALRAKKVDPLTERQGGRIMSAFYDSTETPKLDALAKEADRLGTEVQDYRLRFFCRAADCEPENHYYTQFFEEAQQVCEGSDEPDCFAREINDRCRPALKSYHQGWLTRMEKFWAATNAYHRASTKRMSAVAEHIADPHRHAIAMLAIDAWESAHYYGVLQEAGFWAHDEWIRADHCIEPYEDPATTASPDAAAANGAACPEALKSSNALLDVGPVQLKFSCEQVQLAGNLGEGWIRGFGEVTYDFKAGKISVFAGSQGEIGGGPLKADFKSGLYVTVNQQGFEDAGWRVGPSVTVGGGPAEYNPSDMVDISFVGIFSGGAR